MKVIIVGGGQVGTYLTKMLLDNGHDVCLIEHRERMIKKIAKELSHVLTIGYGSDPDVLEKAGVMTADVVAAVSDQDEINLVVSTLAKTEFGVPRVVARVNNPKNAWLFNSGMGVDVGLNQADLMAHFVVEEMDIEDILTLLKFRKGDCAIISIKVAAGSKAENEIIKNLSIPKKTVLIAITRGDTMIIPKGDTKILVDDDILVLADEQSHQELKQIFY